MAFHDPNNTFKTAKMFHFILNVLIILTITRAITHRPIILCVSEDFVELGKKFEFALSVYVHCYDI